MKKRTSASETPPGSPGDVSIVLISTRNPLNIGAVARAMSNFGFRDLRLVEPYEESWREARSAVGASAVLEAARLYSSTQAAIADRSLVVGTASMGHRELRQSVWRLDEGVRKLTGERVAILFGSEKYGLSNDDLSYCHWLMRIPTREQHESMNLGQAVAVCLYEMVRATGASPGREKRTREADSASIARLEDLLMEVLHASGYVAGKTAASTRLKTRRLLRRMGLSGRDAQVWLGILKQIRWKLRQGTRAGTVPHEIPADPP